MDVESIQIYQENENLIYSSHFSRKNGIWNTQQIRLKQLQNKYLHIKNILFA